MLTFAVGATECYNCISSDKSDGECRSVEPSTLKSCATGHCFTIQARLMLYPTIDGRVIMTPRHYDNMS